MIVYDVLFEFLLCLCMRNAFFAGGNGLRKSGTKRDSAGLICFRISFLIPNPSAHGYLLFQSRNAPHSIMQC